MSKLHKPPSQLSDFSGTIHFIGIGGIGMSALAKLMLVQGLQITGSDRQPSSIIRQLEKLGAAVAIGHTAQNIQGVSAVVVSTAIPGDNPELTAAIASGLPVWHRSDILAALSEQSKLIAVSGTHGKTTTTGMIAQVLIEAQFDPSVVIGGIFSKIESNARAGKGDYFVAEIDESDGTQIRAKPYISVITNIEPDHLENYPGGLPEIQRYMADFAGGSSALIVLCADDPGCKMLTKELSSSADRKIISYGTRAVSPEALYSYETAGSFAMSVFKRGTDSFTTDKMLGQIMLGVPGEHNKLNALAAVALATELGIEFDTIKKALQEFQGVGRRFEVLGESSAVLVVDDYAHHPTEVKATLEAARTYARSQGRKGRIVAVFQPHQPRRLRDLWDEFRKCFKGADLLILTDVYIARGEPIPGINSQEFAAVVDHDNVIYIGGAIQELAGSILPHLRSGDLVLTIGAGSITQLGPELIKLLKAQPAGSAGEKSNTKR
jgi:UDP-N-acetylmuramate--alanine ligase